VNPDKFRYILLAGFVMLMCIGVWHRVKARTGEALERRQEGMFSLVVLRLSGLASFAVLIAFVLNPAGLAFCAVPLPIWLRWVGVGLACLTGLLLFWTLQTLGKNLTDTVVTRKQHTLVVTGPYQWVRHPFYICAALLILAMTLTAANALFLVPGGLVILLLGLRTRVEERNLLNRFGEDYRKYMQRTGRFFPRF
jgi:protein-S-isoprenylcysteine O-methyltransferase Ste14